MDFISSLISQISPVISSSGSSDSLPQKFFSQLNQNLVNFNFGESSVTKISDGKYLIKTPSLSNILSGVSQITVNTSAPLDNFKSFKILPSAFTFTGGKADPALELTGNITQNRLGQPASVSDKSFVFSTKIPLDSINNLSQRNSFASQSQSNLQQQPSLALQQGEGDKVLINRDNLINSSFGAKAQNLNLTIVNILKNVPGFENFKLDNPNNFQIKFSSFTDPKGNNVILNSLPQLPANSSIAQNAPVLNGVLEILPNSKEAILRTEFGNFRLPAFEGIPNGSKVSFFIEAIAKPVASDSLSLSSLNQIQSILQGENSPLSNLLQSLTQTPQGAEFATKIFPNVFDKFSYARNLWFISSAAAGDLDAWLGKDAKLYLQSSRVDSENLINSMRDLFSALKASFRADSFNVEGWNQYLVPFYNGKNLDMVNFYTETQRKNEKDNRDSKSRKFIVEFEQEKYGQILIEGLYVNGDKGSISELDFIIAAENGFDNNEQKEIKSLFHSLSDNLGFAGNLIFKETVPDFEEVLNSKISHQDIVI